MLFFGFVTSWHGALGLHVGSCFATAFASSLVAFLVMFSNPTSSLHLASRVVLVSCYKVCVRSTQVFLLLALRLRKHPWWFCELTEHQWGTNPGSSSCPSFQAISLSTNMAFANSAMDLDILDILDTDMRYP